MSSTSPLVQESGAQAGGVATWTLDPAHTVIEFSAKHMMFTTVKGRFGAFRGALRVDEQHPQRSSVEVEIEAPSLDTRTAMRATTCAARTSCTSRSTPRSPSRARAWSCPRARPSAGAGVQGRGRPDHPGHDARGGAGRDVHRRGDGAVGTQIKAFAAFTRFDRKAFGLTWNVALETGGWLVGDEIRIEIETQANPSRSGGHHASRLRPLGAPSAPSVRLRRRLRTSRRRC